MGLGCPVVAVAQEQCRSFSGFTRNHDRKQKRELYRTQVIVAAAAGLPSEIVIGAVREGWNLAWRTMMQQLAPRDSGDGTYRRPESQFRGRFEEPVSVEHAGRYHLYASPVCPWAHRALIVHSLKGLGSAVPISLALPGKSGLWEFEAGRYPDKAHNCSRLIDVYRMNSGGFQGRATVPMLWDRVRKAVVNNESADIIAMLNSDFNALAENQHLDLAPASLGQEMDRWNQLVYANINNGVYRCGFAQSQNAYDRAVHNLFSALETVEKHLQCSRFLCGDSLTLADIRLFTTLYRFDAVYHILFKCSKRKLSEFSNLYGYMRQIYQIPGVSSTCNLPSIMDGYYGALFPLNPGGIQPAIPSSMEPKVLYNQ
ncbi:hypothetical protein SELMODRAFT_94435 [Selaginella moellendorffii]|uniref:GST C-terminal domain-containing protein n=1 Tax=Selaginella moellendorffii TaxID=88036 RepID=D8RI19_SELML|nr:uncharacterized protein LOC9632965 [Selaginella moellendorffii]EFJ28167.1 hypothetical protein SELMODRAFT_94435 [Selaginella moellendorffii]|eukprot:XP_002970841.1 uncharacterized protein LOC9632965 [Selaginella moellendorffii]